MWSCEEVYNSLLDIVDPSKIDEIKEDDNKLKTPEQRIDELNTLVASVHASAAEASEEMAAQSAGRFQI